MSTTLSKGHEMAPRGRPPKPVEEKRRLGNPGKRPLPDNVTVLPAAAAPPAPLRELGPAGLQTWERIWGRAIHWLSPDSDIDFVQLLCEAIDERDALRVQVLRDGDARDRRALRNLEAQIMSGLSALGFTPTDRARMGLAEVKVASKLEEIIARKTVGR
jgi:hypothetical protein